MTTDATRRLLSIDLLDEDERADLDEWGNRAVLTLPTAPVSIPVVFAAQVGAHPRRGRGDLRGPFTVVSGTR